MTLAFLNVAAGATTARIAAFFLLAASGACAVTPSGPRGPLMGRGVELATALSYATTRGEATTATGSSISGPVDWFYVPGLDGAGLEARVSPLEYVDLGGQVNLTGGGLDVRVGLPARDGLQLAANVAAGLETGAAGLVEDTKSRRSQWLRLEIYPRLISTERLWLVLALGLNHGAFYHSVPIHSSPVYLEVEGLSLIRRETRLETSIGLFYAPGKRTGIVGTMLLTINPYFVLDAKSPSGPCDGCDSGVVSYRQEWGFVVVTRFAIHLAPGATLLRLRR